MQNMAVTKVAAILLSWYASVFGVRDKIKILDKQNYYSFIK